MPELPEVEAVVRYLREHTVGHRISRVELGSVAALKTFDPPLTALEGSRVTDVHRRGKFIVIQAENNDDPCALAVHLSRAGWLHWRDEVPASPLRPGKGPIALRLQCVSNDGEPLGGFDITEAGTRKGLAIWVVRDEREIPRLASLGPEPLDLSAREFAEILSAAGGAQVKGVLRDQARIAGIGNAYSDEVLHVAQLSPFAPCRSLTDDDVERLHAAIHSTLMDAIERSLGMQPALLKAEKRAGMRVHGRMGKPCPACGDVVREVSFAASSLNYCATCQTGGKPLADRRMSRLLR